MNLIDTHAHLNDSRFAPDLDSVMDRAREAGIHTIIVVGYDLASSRSAIALAATNPSLLATAGIHPHEAAKADDQSFEELRRLAASEGVVALGEIGLDYYYDHSPHPVQQEVFRRQIRLARSLSLPVIVHDRDAHADVLTILQEENVDTCGGVMHCFSGDAHFAAQCLDAGLYISLAGPVTFKNAPILVDVAKAVPLDRLLLETDAPYLAPVPCRGKRNEPSYLRWIAEKVAQLRGISCEELSEQTTENAKKLFRIP